MAQSRNDRLPLRTTAGRVGLPRATTASGPEGAEATFAAAAAFRESANKRQAEAIRCIDAAASPPGTPPGAATARERSAGQDAGAPRTGLSPQPPAQRLDDVTGNARGKGHPGDCDGSGVVAVDELALGVDVALDPSLIGLCRLIDTDNDEIVSVDELVTATRSRLTSQVGAP